MPGGNTGKGKDAQTTPNKRKGHSEITLLIKEKKLRPLSQRKKPTRGMRIAGRKKGGL